jgi:Fungal protein kinase
MLDWWSDKDGKLIAIGVLNDWDMASRLDDTHQVPRSSATHRTGTLPFMSIQLLTNGKENEVPHRYRHDLESFFYILLWAVVFYDLETHSMIALPDKADDLRKLRDWRGDDIEHNTNFKRNLFCTPGFYNQVVEDALRGRRQWAPVVNRYLNPIQNILSDLYGYLQRAHTKAKPVAVESPDGSGEDTDMDEDEDSETEDGDINATGNSSEGSQNKEGSKVVDPVEQAEAEQKKLDDMFNYHVFMKAIEKKP